MPLAQKSIKEGNPMNATHPSGLQIIITVAGMLSPVCGCRLYSKAREATVPLRAILFTLCLSCCYFISACAPIPAHVPLSLRQTPQPRNAHVDALGTDGHADMIIWKQPDLNQPWPASLPSGPALADYSVQTCGGPAGKLFHEWQDVPRPDKQDSHHMWLVHGKAAASEFSGADFWGNHRYRDWNLLLVVNRESERFLVPANFLALDWEDSPIAHDLLVDNPDLENLMEMEWDSGFFPPEMAPEAGDETLVVGRWAFDCGHEGAAKNSLLISTGFRAEIHAPAILMSSHIVESTPSSIQARFKIYAGSRGGPMDTIPLLFFLQRLWGSRQNPLGGQDYSLNLGAPSDGWKIASCRTQQGTLAGGRHKYIKTNLESQDGGKSLTLTFSAHEFSKTARIEGSTIANVHWVRADSLPSGGVSRCE